MANVAEKYGLRPVRKLDGSPFINAQNRYRIKAGYATAIFQGDLVIPTSTGFIQRATAGTSAAVVGVFNGVFYNYPTTQKPTWKNYYPGSVTPTQGEIIASVIDDPEVVYSMDSDGAFAVADIFKNFSITNATGNVQTGISKVQLDYSAAGTANTFAVQAIDVSQDVSSNTVVAANVDVLVRINNHFYSYGGNGTGL